MDNEIQDSAAVAKNTVDQGAKIDAAPKGRDYEHIVEHWFNSHVANSPISHSVPAANHLRNVALPKLIEALKTGG